LEKELIINSTPTEVEIAIVEDRRLTELHKEKTNSKFTVGDIFLGKVKKLIPGLNAAFVDIGYDKDAFLHYTDLGPKLRSLIKYTDGAISGGIQTHKLDTFKFEAEIIKTGKIDKVLDKNQSILVQILKEPISTKGPRLSCEMTIPGRYTVLTPFSNVVAVSKKVSNPEERSRLLRLVESIRPKNFGVIVRTAAEGKGTAELHEEMAMLQDKWELIHKQLHKAKPPDKLLSELDKTSSILRDLMTDNFNKIVVNDKDMQFSIKKYLSTLEPDMVKNVQYYNSNKPIFEAFGITKQIKASFGKTATMSSGAYLVIEPTEAMHVVDVNSGQRVGNHSDQENNALSVNLESAKEIARQLRLRDIGGIIIIDFIDVKKQENKRMIHQRMKDCMKNDRAQHTILPLSKFGLMQITRQRVRPAITINTSEICPSCEGSGQMGTPSLLLTEKIEREINLIFNQSPSRKMNISVHPYVFAYLKQGMPSLQMRWFMKWKKWIKVKPDSNYSFLEYHFFDENNDEIRLS